MTSSAGPALAEWTFTIGDVAAFAELSGDYNPLHVDPVAARRTHFGDCVVHGVLLLMWALDAVEKHAGVHKQVVGINARFIRPVVVGSRVSATVARVDAHQTMVVECEGKTAVQCDLRFAQHPGNSTAGVRATLPPREAAASTPLSSLSGDVEHLDLHWSEEHARRLFPALARSQPAAVLATLTAATRIVGMKMPGLHSIFVQLDLSFEGRSEGSNALTYRLASYHKSTQRVAVALSGSAHGTLLAQARPEPVSQSGMSEVQRLVPPGSFEGRRVLVVGGSRGLGELTAKALAAGGATVSLTYRLGSADAARIVADIQEHGGRADAFQLEIGGDGWERDLAAHAGGNDHVCYFATPPIMEGDGERVSELMLEKYLRCYVTGLIEIAQWLARETSGKFLLFNASSVYVDRPPMRQLEYAAAKAASEACCRWLKVAHPQARIHVARFPRLLTDQTASLLSSSEHQNLPIVMTELSRWLAE